MDAITLTLADEHLDKLKSIYDRCDTYTENVRRASLPMAVEMYVILKDLAEKHEALGKQLSEAITTLKQQVIPTRFEDEKVTSFTTKSGHRVTVSVSTRANMTDKEQGMQWLRDNGLGDIVTETVNASTLSSVAKTLLEDGKELPDEFFKTYLQPNTSVTKVKAKSAT